MLMFFKKKPPPFAPVLHAYDDDFDELLEAEKGVALVDFWAPWCAPCHMMERILDEVAIEQADRGVRVLKVEVDQAPETAQRFEVKSIPTLVFFLDGEPQFEMVGPVPKPVLEREISELLGGAVDTDEPTHQA
jgi:thioredoxin 1